MRILICILCLFLTGCATSMKGLYDDQGRLVGVEGSGKQKSYIKQAADGSVEYGMDNKQEPLINLDLNAAKVN